MNETDILREEYSSDMNDSDIMIGWNGSSLPDPIHNSTLLEQLNAARRILNIPIIIFLFFVMFAGILGNGLVIIIYRFYSPKTSANFFILVLAILDCGSCVVFIPFQLYDLWNPYTNALPILCRILRYLENHAYLYSGFIFICISCERYVKICYPFHSYSVSRAKTVAFIVFVISLTITWPQFVMHGRKTMIIGPDRVVGEDCSHTNEFQNSIYALLYHYLLYFVYIVCFIMFFFFYGNILHVIIKRRLKMRPQTNEHPGGCRTDSLGGVGGIKMRSSRTTICLSMVVLTGVASFVPFLTLQTLRTSGSYFKETILPSGEYFHYGSSKWSEYMYMFGLRSYYLGSLANPIIYSIINPNFRSRSKIPFNKLKVKLSDVTSTGFQ